MQPFERGSLISHAAHGFEFVLSAYQVGDYIDNLGRLGVVG
jgi:hypothetical protein